ncbi:MAG: glycoside hydrolase family 13 protein [Chloroflexota bacterium]|nr:glycoside hydrolase family 13 protein [Chloroflexota bacterium]
MPEFIEPSSSLPGANADALAAVTADFIFGTLATDEQRIAALREQTKGLRHDGRISPHDPEPGVPVEVEVVAGSDTTVAAIEIGWTTDGSEPDDSSPSVALMPGEVSWDMLRWGYVARWRTQLPAQPAHTLVRYRFAATDERGAIIPVDPDSVTGMPARHAYAVDDGHVPSWLRDAVIYHVFVDRFAPGGGRDWAQPATLDGFFGGSLRGLIERLPYLVELGVTCLWLSPVFPSPSHHGYDATDYRAVEPRLGSEAELREVFAAAHDHGLRVLLDFVANHVSDRHPAFQRARRDPTSPERSWFTFLPDGSYRSFFDVAAMPRIDTDEPAARDYLLEAARFWLDAGADGFRLDYANGPSHAFWAAFRQATRTVKPDSVTIGEVVEAAPLQASYLGRLDGTLDFLLLQQLRALLAFDLIGPAAFHRFLDRHLAYFPADFTLPSFLDNHDMNRFLWVAGGDTRRLKMAALLQFTLPHPPVIYYGTEVGLSQRHDLAHPDGSRRMEESRLPMRWGDEQDPDLFQFYRRLIALRRAHSALWRTPVSAGRPLVLDESGLYVVQIGDTAILALNRADDEATITVPTDLALVLATESAARYDGARLYLPPMTGALLLPAGSPSEPACP